VQPAATATSRAHSATPTRRHPRITKPYPAAIE
jgi:hypothetical protein